MNLSTIPFKKLSAQWKDIEPDCLPEILSFLESGDYVNRGLKEQFELYVCNYLRTKYCIGVSSGTVALEIALKALSLSDDTCVIIPANTYIANALSIKSNNFTIQLIDVDNTYAINVDLLKQYIVENRSKYTNMVIMPVHLYGLCANMVEINTLAKEFDCYIIEDFSQAFGSKTSNQLVGTFGDINIASCYPTKNLGSAGEAGIITTNSESLYIRIKQLINMGEHTTDKNRYSLYGTNARINNIQCIILKHKLNKMNEWIAKTKLLSYIYQTNLHTVMLPKITNIMDPYFHLYPVRVRNREKLINILKNNSIEFGTQYQIPIQKQEIFKYLDKGNNNTLLYSKQIVTLPIYPHLGIDNTLKIVKVVNQYND